MSFIHEDPELPELLAIVASEIGISQALVEKDYWVTHTLWALQESGLDLWFKGGTSLSKGFGLIQRFSEDLDLRLEPGRAAVPQVKSWTSANKGPVAERRNFFEALEPAIDIPQARLRLDPTQLDKRARGACYHVEYPGIFLNDLGPEIRPFVLLEVGIARVTPFIPRSLSSFVHDWLGNAGKIEDFTENRPQVRCVHPLVTLIEKLDAISRRYARHLDPASFIRHYEDAARIIAQSNGLPPLEPGLPDLVDEMLTKKQISHRPESEDPAILLANSERAQELFHAYREIASMYWGERSTLEEACEVIRGWLIQTLPS